MSFLCLCLSLSLSPLTSSTAPAPPPHQHRAPGHSLGGVCLTVHGSRFCSRQPQSPEYTLLASKTTSGGVESWCHNIIDLNFLQVLRRDVQ